MFESLIISNRPVCDDKCFWQNFLRNFHFLKPFDFFPIPVDNLYYFRIYLEHITQYSVELILAYCF